MENLVLYRKYRPQSFSEIIGQEHIVQTLVNSLKGKNISHAYLFSGPKGSGKTTIARIFAKAINCENESDFEPCDKCSSCLDITEARAIDLVEIDAGSHTSVDNIRELTEGVKFAPVKSKYKVFIIDECHQLSKSAANALLKTLEEPPSHVVFILATTEAYKMIPTVVSRCQRFDFRKLQASEIIKKLEFILQKEKIKFEKQALPLIAFNAWGSLRDAESILDKCIAFTGPESTLKTSEIKEALGLVEISQVSQMVDFILSKQEKVKEAVLRLNSMIEEGIDLQEFAKTLIFYLREMMMLKINPSFLNSQNSGFSDEEIKKLNSQIANLSEREIRKMLELFIGAENKMKYSSILQLPLELAVIEICLPS